MTDYRTLYENERKHADRMASIAQFALDNFVFAKTDSANFIHAALAAHAERRKEKP